MNWVDLSMISDIFWNFQETFVKFDLEQKPDWLTRNGLRGHVAYRSWLTVTPSVSLHFFSYSLCTHSSHLTHRDENLASGMSLRSCYSVEFAGFWKKFKKIEMWGYIGLYWMHRIQPSSYFLTSYNYLSKRRPSHHFIISMSVYVITTGVRSLFLRKYNSGLRKFPVR